MAKFFRYLFKETAAAQALLAFLSREIGAKLSSKPFQNTL
jgi:hypothetical protein